MPINENIYIYIYIYIYVNYPFFLYSVIVTCPLFCLIMVHVLKASWACGVQAEGSDFKGTHYTCFVLVVGVPNVGKSALINLIHQIASSRFPGKLLLCFC